MNKSVSLEFRQEKMELKYQSASFAYYFSDAVFSHIVDTDKFFGYGSREQWLQTRDKWLDATG